MLARFSVFGVIIFLLASSFPEPTYAHPRYHRYRRFNISNFIYPRQSDNAPADELLTQPAPPSSFLKEVVNAIGKKEKWDSNEVKITQLDLKNLKIGALQRYELRVEIGRSEQLVFKLLDQMSPWERLSVKNVSDFEALVKEIGSKAVLDSFKIQGPFHLSVAGDHNLTLSLPRNGSFAGLRHVLVGEGITVEVNGASEVSMLHGKNTHNFVDRRAFDYLRPPLCMALLPIIILGSATVVSYRSHNPEAHIQTLFLSKRTVELLPAKCYSGHVYGKWGFSINFLGQKIPLLEKVMEKFVGQKTNQDPGSGSGSGSLQAKLIASTVFHFKLELKIENHSNDSKWSTLADWKTKPNVERVWYDVIARADGDVLKPVLANKVKPTDEIDTKDWSISTTNISFTKLPAVLLPQNSLTLDVKW